MTDLHHHHTEERATVVRETDGPGVAAVLVTVLVLALVGFVVWMFAANNDGGTVVERPVPVEQETVPTEDQPVEPAPEGQTSP